VFVTETRNVRRFAFKLWITPTAVNVRLRRRVVWNCQYCISIIALYSYFMQDTWTLLGPHFVSRICTTDTSDPPIHARTRGRRQRRSDRTPRRKRAAAVFSLRWPTDETATEIIAVTRSRVLYRVRMTCTAISLSGNRDIVGCSENGGERLYPRPTRRTDRLKIPYVESGWPRWFPRSRSEENAIVATLFSESTPRYYTWSLLYSLYIGRYMSAAVFTPLINQCFTSLLRNYNKVFYR